jgi:hypothetical protein
LCCSPSASTSTTSPMLPGPVAAELWPQDQGRSSLLLYSKCSPNNPTAAAVPTAKQRPSPGQQHQVLQGIAQQGAKHMQSGMT